MGGATIYANGRRVGTVDALGADLDSAMETVATNIERRQIDAVTKWGRDVLSAGSGEPS